jgi:hypothetical protein
MGGAEGVRREGVREGGRGVLILNGERVLILK